MKQLSITAVLLLCPALYAQDRVAAAIDSLPSVKSIDQVAISPDGLQVAYIVAGELFVAPVPNGPSGNITDPTPTFSWSAVPGAESYTLYVLRVSDEAVMLRETGIPGTSFTPASPLPAGVNLRWKVKGESSCGPGPYSPSVYFVVQPSG